MRLYRLSIFNMGHFPKTFPIFSLQFWACYVHCNTSTNNAVRVSLDQLDTIKKFVHRYPKDFQWVTTAQG